MTVLPLTTPRNFPTVVHDRLPGASGVSPMVTCAPLTARTRPSASRRARAGAAGGAAVGFTRVIPVPSVVDGAARRPPCKVIAYETTLEFPLNPGPQLDLNRELTLVRAARLK